MATATTKTPAKVSAANGQQRTISVVGKNVISNGRLVGQYKSAGEAQKAAQGYLTVKKNVAGSGISGTPTSSKAGPVATPVKTTAPSATFTPSSQKSVQSSSSKKTYAPPAETTTEKTLETETSPFGYAEDKKKKTFTRDLAAEQKALSDALKSTAEGGANQGLPAGTDVPSYLEKNPGFRQLLQEQVNTRVYGRGNPTFAEPAANVEAATTGGESDAGATYEEPPAATEDTSMYDTTDWLKKFGVDSTTAGTGDESTLADTSGVDQEMEALADEQYNLKAVDDRYQSNLESIRQKYDRERDQARTEAENRKGERFSELAALGGNPSSSAGASLENEKQLLLSKFMSDISARESAEKAAASADYNNERQNAIANRMNYLSAKKAGITSAEETKYQRGQDSLNNAISILNATLSAAQTKQSLSQTEKNNAIKSFETMFNTFGSSAFDGATPDDLRSFEKALGLSSGTLKTAIDKFKAEELKAGAEKPELREVDGSLYQLTWDDASGTYLPSILVKKQKSTSGNPSGQTTVSINGQPVEQSVVDAAKNAWQQAYADNYAALSYLADKDKLAEVVTSFIYNGGSSSNNPFMSSRTTAEDQYGSGNNDVWSFLEGGDNASGAGTDEGSAAGDVWSQYGLSDPFSNQ